MTAIQDTTYWTSSCGVLLQCYCIRYYSMLHKNFMPIPPNF